MSYMDVEGNVRFRASSDQSGPHMLVAPVSGRERIAHPNISLRDWQIDAKDKVIRDKAAGRTNFLVCATPGAGKTNFALDLARTMMTTGEVERVTVVVPSCHLKHQWAAAAQRFGLRLTANWENDATTPEQPDTHGVVLTYAQVASFPEASRIHSSRRRTLVIHDEIHHAGTGRSWGDALRNAFEPAIFRLLLSGTPFRSDESLIPFVQYEGGRSRPDYSYGYGAALRDNVCRPIIFPSFEGRMEWLEGEDTVTATFADELEDQQVSRRLRTALDASGGWLADVVRNADERLTEIRNAGHADAGGLIVAIDQRHAQAIGDLVRRITGVPAQVATSDDPEASAVIERFRRSSERWIVAVKMVSEGVDIPRLRVGVYASNVVSELFVRQWTGRFVRVQPNLPDDDSQFSYAFLPKDERLTAIISSIQQERDHVLQERQTGSPQDGVNRARMASGFLPVSSEASPDEIYAQGQVYTPILIAEARRIRSQGSPLLQRIPEIAVAEMLRVSQMAPLTVATPNAPDNMTRLTEGTTVSTLTYDEENQHLRQMIVQVANRIARTTSSSHTDIHRAWYERSGIVQRQATNDQLRQKLSWLNGILAGQSTLPR